MHIDKSIFSEEGNVLTNNVKYTSVWVRMTYNFAEPVALFETCFNEFYVRLRGDLHVHVVWPVLEKPAVHLLFVSYGAT